MKQITGFNKKKHWFRYVLSKGIENIRLLPLLSLLMTAIIIIVIITMIIFVDYFHVTFITLSNTQR